MKESRTVTNNVQVSNHIPHDIAISILSKLSLKSLKRFECVRKSWSLLFDDPYFMTIYRNNFLSKDCSYYDDTCLLLALTGSGYEYNPSRHSRLVSLYFLSGENFENTVRIDWPKPFPEDNLPFFRIMDSTCVNGIICLSTFHHENWRLILWNPTTNEFKVIPRSHFEPRPNNTLYHLFGYDHIKDDYKVIRFKDYHGNDPLLYSLWDIYSLSSNCWRTIFVKMHLFSHNKDVYMDGVSHWWDKNRTHTYLGSFDFCNESFTTTPIPSYIDDDSFEVNRDLMILNGSIAFILNYKNVSTIHILILGELGVKESWTKLFIVGPSPSLNYPIVAAKKGKILLRSSGKNQLVWFDLSTGLIDEVDFTKQKYLHYSFSKTIFFYLPSL